MTRSENNTLHWVDGLKAFAIIAILLNHGVESFGFFPWFSSISNYVPEFSKRILNISPSSGNIITDIIIFMGWLGDMGPGIFILLSGLTLTLSSYQKKRNTLDFYRQRALRIYPLYITIHLIILVLVVFIFKWRVDILSPKTLFSFAGIRFMDSLFFYINPSWWFIWAILQLYFFFPFLLKLLQQRGSKTFLVITLLITLISHLAGLIFISDITSLYNWRTGIFAGTRLFEFTVGMYIGLMIYNKNEQFSRLLSEKRKLLLYSVFLYICGLLCTLAFLDCLISKFTITISVAGIFYSIYYLLCKFGSKIKQAILWIGRNSFSVFLIHQPLMMYASSKLEKGNLVFALLFIVCISFLAGYYIEKATNYGTPYFLNIVDRIKGYISKMVTPYHIFFLLLVLIIYSFLLPFVSISGTIRQFLMPITLLILCAFIYILREKQRFRSDITASRILDVAFLISAGYIILTRNWHPLYWAVIFSGIILIILTKKLNYFISLGLTGLIILTGILGCELYLRRDKPLEVMHWGELPALQPDPITGYSLISSRTTHLKYNNYDYIIRTNSSGLASPEISSGKNTGEYRIFIIGDAFTMPEGMEYELSYPFLFEEKFRSAHPEQKINIINGGVTGYGPNEFYAQLEKYIDKVKPDLVINQFFVNEFEEINFELHSRNSGIGFDLKKSFRSYYFANTQVPAHYRNCIHKFFKQENSSYRYWKSLIYLYEKDSPLYSDSVLVKMDDYFSKIQKFCNEKNSELMVMFVPGQIAVSEPGDIDYFPHSLDINDTLIYSFEKPNRIIREICTTKGILFTDLTDTLKNHHNQPVYFPESWHWNSEGHKVAAQKLFEEIITLKFNSYEK